MYPYSGQVANNLTTAELTLSPKPDRKLLDLLQARLREETQAHADYLYHWETAAEQEKPVFYALAMDEAKHASVLRQMIEELTGAVPAAQTAKDPKSQPQKDLFALALEEAEDGETYRALMLSFLNRSLRDRFFELMTDEMLHAQKLNTLAAARAKGTAAP